MANKKLIQENCFSSNGWSTDTVNGTAGKCSN